jgi:hypothetical protein
VMRNVRQHLPVDHTIAVDYVRNDHPQHVDQALQALAAESLRRLLVAPALHQHVEPMAGLIDRSPQMIACLVDGENTSSTSHQSRTVSDVTVTPPATIRAAMPGAPRQARGDCLTPWRMFAVGARAHGAGAGVLWQRVRHMRRERDSGE